MGHRARNEPEQLCLENVEKLSEEFGLTLQDFLNSQTKERSMAKNYFARNYIESIGYSKEEISINFFYQSSCGTQTNLVNPPTLRRGRQAAKTKTANSNCINLGENSVRLLKNGAETQN